MNRLYDITLSKPLPDGWLEALLFVTFTLHMVFVLTLLGTAIIGVCYLVRRSPAGNWSHCLLRTLYVHKSLAVVLGVAPLLLMQVGHPVPFMTATNLLGTSWLLAIPVIIAAFIFLQGATESIDGPHRRSVLLALAGITCLLVIPGIFVAALVTTEHPDQWGPIFTSGGRLPQPLAAHWALRFVHIIGAAVLGAGVFHYIRIPRDQAALRKSLLAWARGAVLLQFVAGIGLFLSLREIPPPLILATMLLGALPATFLFWVIFKAQLRSTEAKGFTLVHLLLLTLILMLLTRQMLQGRVLRPMAKGLSANARQHASELETHRPAALANYRQVTSFSRSDTSALYNRACGFCHGPHGDGHGQEALNLAIAPTDLTAIRARDGELRRILMEGVPGTGMPPFRIYTPDEIERLIGLMRTQFSLTDRLEPLPTAVAPATRTAARHAWLTCSSCHGQDGRGTAPQAGFRPPPPDFTVYSLSPQRIFDAITNGRPGTAMPAFSHLPKDLRWGLVEITRAFYR